MGRLPECAIAAHDGLPGGGAAVQSVIGSSQIATPSIRRSVVAAWLLLGPQAAIFDQDQPNCSPTSMSASTRRLIYRSV
jgi:hypothetical protein